MILCQHVMDVCEVIKRTRGQPEGGGRVALRDLLCEGERQMVPKACRDSSEFVGRLWKCVGKAVCVPSDAPRTTCRLRPSAAII